MRRVAYVIVTWNNADIIQGCLDSILAQTGVDPVIHVLDNASADATVAVVKKYPQIQLTRSRQNLGFARGNNILIRQALRNKDVEWVALVNSDATLDPGWTTALLNYVEGRSHVAAVQGLTLDYYDHDVVDSQHIFVSGNLQGIQYGYGQRVDAASYYPRKVFGVNAAAAMFSREFIENQPDPDSYFFDERFYMYYEDVDVAYRALVAGYDSYFVPTALAYHMGSVSTKKRKKTYSSTMVARNQLAMIYKNTPVKVFLMSIPSLLFGVQSFVRQAREDFGPSGALRVVGSFILGLFRLPLYARSRRAIHIKSHMDSVYLMSIMHHDGIRGC